MRRNGYIPVSSIALALAGTLGLAGCDVDVPDLNNPGLEQLEDDPTATRVGAACTGLLIGTRAGTSAPNGYISQLGILGRESYTFDPADPRYISELLEGQLSPASPFGGAFWAQPYTNMRLGDIILRAKDDVVDFDDSQKAAVSGFVQTIRSLDLLRIITTRDEIGAVIDTDHGIDELGEMVSKEEVLAEIARLLDAGASDLEEGGDAFPFELSSGFAGFSTPSSFLRFNRALRARVATYQEDYETVLDLLVAPPDDDPDDEEVPQAEAFIDDTVTDVEGLEVGVYHAFSTASGDVTNGLISVNIYTHASVVADAEPGDARVARKVVTVEEAFGLRDLESNLKFTIYTDPSDSVPIIRNEDLILLRAEARLFTGDLAGAQADLDLIRTVSGELDSLTAGQSEDELFDELLYNRRYSLLFEGHRLIDMRRFGLIDELPLDIPDEHQRNIRWPLPSAECDARPGEPACGMTSVAE